MGKVIVCFCEDVTLDEIRKAIKEGYRDLEHLKRLLGIGTGPCQGKQCLITVARILAEDTGISVSEIRLPTFRPPARPVPLGVLAGAGLEEE